MILVTGGAGYIGAHAVRALARAGFEPVVFDNFSTGHRDFTGERPVVEGDIDNPRDLETAFEAYPIEGVVHFAGRALVEESRTKPALYYETNVGGGVNLLNAMRGAGVHRIIFSSTCATYGVPETADIAEDHPQRPINPYGETKLAFERALEWFRVAYGIEYLSLRYFNAAGADADATIGEDHDPETHLIPLVLEAAAGLRSEARVHGTDYPTPDGTCVRDFIHVTDLAEAHAAGLGLLISGGVASQGLNLGTGKGASVREVIDEVRRVTGREFPVVETPRRSGDPPRLVASTKRAADLLGWSPAHSSLTNIVETAWEWLKKRRKL